MVIHSPNLSELWLIHGFGDRDTVYPENLTTVKQIHSGIVIDATESTRDDVEGDALISGQIGLIVAVKTADCVPVLLADARTRAVAAVHAGWRGTVENIVGATVRRMGERFGTRSSDVRAAIGPSIGACCYEVSPDVAQRFREWVPGWGDQEYPIHIDLARVNLLQLRKEGVEDIRQTGLCTKCNPDRFWSFRGQGLEAGRMFSFIGRIA